MVTDHRLFYSHVNQNREERVNSMEIIMLPYFERFFNSIENQSLKTRCLRPSTLILHFHTFKEIKEVNNKNQQKNLIINLHKAQPN